MLNYNTAFAEATIKFPRKLYLKKISSIEGLWSFEAAASIQFVTTEACERDFLSGQGTKYEVIASGDCGVDEQGNLIRGAIKAYYVALKQETEIAGVRFKPGIKGVCIVPTEITTVMYFPKDSSEMFRGLKIVTSFDLIKIRANEVEIADRMFYGCGGNLTIKLFKLAGFKQLKSAVEMFACSGVTTLDRISITCVFINDGKYVDTTGLFRGCCKLKYASFDKLNAIAKNYIYFTGNAMFEGCSSLVLVNTAFLSLPSGKPRYLDNMFRDCEKLQYLIMPEIDTTEPTSFKNWLWNVNSLRYISMKRFASKYKTNPEPPFEGVRHFDIINRYIETSVPSWVMCPVQYFMNYGTISAVCDMISRQLGEDDLDGISEIYPKPGLEFRGFEVTTDDGEQFDRKIMDGSEDIQKVLTSTITFKDDRVLLDLGSMIIRSITTEIGEIEFVRLDYLKKYLDINMLNPVKLRQDVNVLRLGNRVVTIFGRTCTVNEYLRMANTPELYDYQTDILVNVIIAVITQNWVVREKMLNNRTKFSTSMSILVKYIKDIWKNVDGCPDRPDSTDETIHDYIMNAGSDESVSTADQSLKDSSLDIVGSSNVKADRDELSAHEEFELDSDLDEIDFGSAVAKPSGLMSILQNNLDAQSEGFAESTAFSDMSGDISTALNLDDISEMDDFELGIESDIDKNAIDELPDELQSHKDMVAQDNMHKITEDIETLDIDDMF